MPDATPPPSFLGHTPRAEGGFLWRSMVNGPVESRRLGVSLGLNLLPAGSKVCSFDCPYCECGPTGVRAAGTRWPSPDEVAQGLRRALARYTPAWITLSGNGEPTLHPRFGVVVDRVLAARDALAPATRVAVLSNGLAAGAPPVRDALRRVDARILKLDPGPRALVNGVTFDVEPVLAAYRELAPFTLQAMVARSPEWDGGSGESVRAWVPLVVRAGPARVQLYSLARPPADARVQAVPRKRLEEIAAELRDALPGSAVEVF